MRLAVTLRLATDNRDDAAAYGTRKTNLLGTEAMIRSRAAVVALV